MTSNVAQWIVTKVEARLKGNIIYPSAKTGSEFHSETCSCQKCFDAYLDKAIEGLNIQTLED